VDSAILRLERRPAPLVPPANRETFHRVAQAAFRQRRKQIHNSLLRELPVDRDTVDGALTACGVDPERRPQTLDLPEWACLTAALRPALDAGRG
jgi:16S rRNA (adenine1518-N6/adenine1519-N6)-dimethyltransferase